MADDALQIPGSNRQLEGVSVTTPAGAPLFREGVVVSDPTTAAARQAVMNSIPVGTEYGAIGRIAGPVMSYRDAIPTNAVTGWAQFRKFGANLNLSSTENYVGTIGGTAPNMPSSAQSIEFVSGNAADALNGAGMREITIIGLDANWNEQTVTTAAHATDGTIAVAVTGTWLRVYRAYVSQVGAYRGANVGAITVRIAGGGASFTAILADRGQSEGSHYCVPAGKTLYITSLHLNANSTKPVDVGFYQAPNANDVATPFTGAKRIVSDYAGIGDSVDYTYDIPLRFPEYTDLWLTGKVATSGSLSAEYVGALGTN